MRAKTGFLMLACLAALGVAVLLLGLTQNNPAMAAATVRYVAPGGHCGGVSPCYPALQAAVDAAADGDEIRVAAGTYAGVQTRVVLKQHTQPTPTPRW